MSSDDTGVPRRLKGTVNFNKIVHNYVILLTILCCPYFSMKSRFLRLVSLTLV